MLKRVGVLLGAVAALAISVTPASAKPGDDAENLHSAEACQKTPGKSKFDLTLWYNSGQNGAYLNIGYSVYDFDALRPGDGHAYPLRYCRLGASNPWPGSGQKIKNNAASGENFHDKYKARIYFHSGYKGAQDVMAPYQHIDRFRNVYNENASFQWTTN
ncbi:hypothetical protein J7F01_14895 [Streptomyces sp. ISL-22]|uniref:hypothetical protein n=1 Tax=unclassified Streptomyces TaxID=2593676 RepID=UPI001BED322F|nr:MULTISPECIES: hypothetical protein [unclassified Streptomyces]MBT2421910.1 hypothetical protein [Streptomyces sp. ISL-24]MBT2433460.1 hypothetical protein [Streptomyces sp. ISL-22]